MTKRKQFTSEFKREAILSKGQYPFISFDGLRFDAVQTIQDDSVPHFLDELARTVYSAPCRKRRIHLMLENDDNNAYYLKHNESCNPITYTAQFTGRIDRIF